MIKFRQGKKEFLLSSSIKIGSWAYRVAYCNVTGTFSREQGGRGVKLTIIQCRIYTTDMLSLCGQKQV